MTAYITVFNLLLWTHGIILMGDNDGLKGAWKNFLSPAILSIVIGIILFLFQLRLPQFIENEYAPWNDCRGSKSRTGKYFKEPKEQKIILFELYKAYCISIGRTRCFMAAAT